MASSPAVITVSYEEVSRTEGYGEDGGFTAQRVLQCAWADRHSLCQQLLGQAYVYTPGGSIDIVLPQEYPDKTGVFVSSAPSIKGFPEENPDRLAQGAGNTNAKFLFARITVDYKQPAFGTSPTSKPRVTESLEPTAEFLTLGTSGLYWDDGGTGIDLEDIEAPSKIIRGLDWVYQISGIPTLPVETLTLVGCVNSTALTSVSLGLLFPAESLLYNPPSLTRYIYPGNGMSAWDLSYRFTYKAQGWNKFYRGGDATPQFIHRRSDGGIFRPYTLASFLPLVG